MIRQFHNMNTFSYLVLLYCILISTGFSGPVSAQEEYHEHLAFHVGRTSYIAGEHIFYKVYCYTDKENATFLSKVLYIELIDQHKKSILAQVLHNENNTAYSILQLPDTLSTGLYYLKAYTQWMRNSGEEVFASYPVYIYNQYDKTLQAHSTCKIPFEPEVYIQGGRLVTGLPTQLQIRIPGLMGEKQQVTLQESYSGDKIHSAVTNEEGYAEFLFTPSLGKRYQLVMGDSVQGKAEFELPQVEYSGYSLQVNVPENGELTVVTDGSNKPPAQLKLKLITGEDIIWEKVINNEYFKKEINTQFSPDYGYYDLLLTDTRDNLLLNQPIVVSPVNIVNSGDSIYSTRESVNIKLDLTSLSLQKGTGLSVSVHKLYSDQDPLVNQDRMVLLRPEKIRSDQELHIIFPRYFAELRSYSHKSPEYLAEDMGMLYSGRLINGYGKSGLKNFQLVLAIKDTMGVFVAATTDSTGYFSMLLNEYGDKEAHLFLSFEGIPLKGDNIDVDEKFYYHSLIPYKHNEVAHTYDSLFVKEMRDEAQRVLIQKAFRNNDFKAGKGSDNSTGAKESFYGEPEIVVYPGEFLFLPNFEEIAREILPRVRYKHTKDKCEITVFHIENGTRSDNPIVMVDGIYVSDFRELYDLNSDDIQRVEIQSGLRVAGQLLYDGLLAIYTTKKYKAEKEKKNGRTVYSIPGYANTNEKYWRNYDGQVGQSGTPDFANQLYWNPIVLPDGNGMADINFNTSDEEGEFVIDIAGYTSEGVSVNYKHNFKVAAHE